MSHPGVSRGVRSFIMGPWRSGRSTASGRSTLLERLAMALNANASRLRGRCCGCGLAGGSRLRQRLASALPREQLPTEACGADEPMTGALAAAEVGKCKGS